MLKILLFFSFLSSTQTFATPGNLLHLDLSPSLSPASIICSAPDGSLTETAVVTIKDGEISIMDTDGPYSNTFTGTVSTDGDIWLQGDGECGTGINFTMDSGLIDGSESHGSAVLSMPSNYGCEGSTSDFNCTVQ